jgi:hypothetical protein
MFSDLSRILVEVTEHHMIDAPGLDVDPDHARLAVPRKDHVPEADS